jgi:hypothetical protein
LFDAVDIIRHEDFHPPKPKLSFGMEPTRERGRTNQLEPLGIEQRTFTVGKYAGAEAQSTEQIHASGNGLS